LVDSEPAKQKWKARKVGRACGKAPREASSKVAAGEAGYSPLIEAGQGTL